MKIAATFFFMILISCNDESPPNTVANKNNTVKTGSKDTLPKINSDSIEKVAVSFIKKHNSDNAITADSIPMQLVAYAQSLLGIPYKYASVNPAVGLDCSGFITYVFNHFNITVPRSSVDFTNYGTAIPANAAKAADLILFTGTDSASKIVGHMGIIISNDNGEIQFIHSTSGKANGVTVTPLNDNYKKRFVKVIRVF